MRKSLIFILLVILFFGANTARAEDKSAPAPDIGNVLNPSWVPDIPKPEWAPDIEGGLTVETKYIWRGQNLVDDFVLQPDASISKYGVTLSYWGNFSTAKDTRKWTEHDLTVDYTVTLEDLLGYMNFDTENTKLLNPFSFSAGNIFYLFPLEEGKNFHSEEFYFGTSYGCILNPSFTFYHDYGRGAGSYLEVGLSQSFDFGKYVTLSGGITYGYNAGEWGYGYKSAPLLFSGDVSITVFKYFKITPNINYSLALDKSKNDDGVGYESEFYGGIRVSASY